MSIYLGAGSTAHKMSKLYVGVGGQARQVQKVYVGHKWSSPARLSKRQPHRQSGRGQHR